MTVDRRVKEREGGGGKSLLKPLGRYSSLVGPFSKAFEQRVRCRVKSEGWINCIIQTRSMVS